MHCPAPGTPVANADSVKLNISRREALRLLAATPALWLGRAFPSRAADLKVDEQVMLFPSTARRVAADELVARVEAWIYELETRPGASQVLARYLGLDLSDLPNTDRARYEARTQLFRVDSESERVLQIRFGSAAPVALPASDANGRVSAEVAVAVDLGAIQAPTWLDYAVLTHQGDARQFSGRALKVPDHGVSVVSDIDDTIKVTQVRDRREMLLNTFAREFVAVPGMAAWMRQCAASDRSMSFHYVSGSPHQLYPPLDQFLTEESFPAGTVHLRTVDLTRVAFQEDGGTREYKLETIGRLMRESPQRRFVLVGDSGEHDPEIYGELGRARRGQVAAIFIRDTTGEAAASVRYAEAMSGLTPETWSVFNEPKGLPISGF
jgi:hypothetical protein